MASNSNFVLENNRNSQILAKLKNMKFDKISNDFISHDNLPNNYKAINEIYPSNTVNGLPTAQTIYKFKIDSTGFLRKLMVKVYIELTGNTLSGLFITPNRNLLAAQLFKNIYLYQDGNRILLHNNPGYIVSRVNDSNSTVQQFYNNIMSAEELDTSATYSTYVYVPIFSYFFDHESNNMFLDNCKNLELHLEYNENLSWDPALSKFIPTLQMFRMCYEQDALNSFIKQNFTKPELNFLSYNVYPITNDLAENDTSVKIDISNKYLIQSIHLCIIDYGEGGGEPEYIPINSISVELGDKNIIKDLTKELSVYNTTWGPDFLSNNEIVTANVQTQSYSYYFGNQRRLMHSGSIDASNSPLWLTVNFDTIPNTAKLYINIEYLNLTTLQHKNGYYHTSLIH